MQSFLSPSRSPAVDKDDATVPLEPIFDKEAAVKNDSTEEAQLVSEVDEDLGLPGI